jgi:hypothetical protein
MNSDFDSTELYALLGEFRDGSLTPERHERLEIILQQSAKARQQWFLFCDVEVGLKDWAVTQDERRSNELPSEPINTAPTQVSSRSRVKIGWLSLAAMLLIAIGLGVWFNRSPNSPDDVALSEAPTSDVAVLTHAVDVVWQEQQKSLAVGATLAPSMLRLQAGALLIEFFSGATVVLEGPAEFEVLSKNEGRLLTGKLNAHVPPQAHGFTIETSAGRIVDQGTDFGLNLAGESQNELHVFTGKVEVQADGKSLDLSSGEAIELGSETGEVFDAKRSEFLVEQQLIERSRLASERRFAQWRQTSNALSNDPATLYHLRLDDSPTTLASERSLVNSASSAESPSGGSLIGGQRVAGRWQGKQAVLFGGPADRIRFTVQQPMNALTLAAWVNVQSLPHWQNSLLATDGESPGSVHWQLTKRGQLRLAIARDLGRPKSDWEAVESDPFLTESSFRQWLLLTTTFDGKTVRHYANGRLVGVGASFTPDAIHIGTAEIGNWLGQTRRELHATLDEFLVVDRVLDAEEIVEIYHNGQP